MGRRDAVWNMDRLSKVLPRTWQRMQAPAGWPALDLPLRVSVPAPIRVILDAWAQEHDPAPLLPRGANVLALRACYRGLARPGAPVRVRRAALLMLHANAAANAQFGMWTDLRAEARALLAWLAPIIAADPLLRERIGAPR